MADKSVREELAELTEAVRELREDEVTTELRRLRGEVERLRAERAVHHCHGCHCGGIHQRACPRVREKEYHPNGNLVRVRYFRTFDDTGVIWPEDAYDPEDGADER